MGIKRPLLVTVVLAILFSTSLSSTLEQKHKDHTQGFSAQVDNEKYIDANNILMFFTNQGSYGRDLSGMFGYGQGTFYPFIDIQSISNGLAGLRTLFAAGLWLGGINQNVDTLIAVSEYAGEFVPGPMAGGTFQTDRTEFKVYKLYRDSLESNPNADYLNWPVDQGAPVDSSGKPAMKGDQMLWTVFNDADPSRHTVDAGSTAPMGVEVQMTVWAFDSTGDFTFYLPTEITADHVGPSLGTVVANVVNGDLLTGDNYMVTFAEPNPGEIVWYLIDGTTGDTLLYDQTNQSGDNNYAIVDGIQVIVTAPPEGISKIEELQNGVGPLVPPVNVMYALNSTGDWFISSDAGNDFSRMNWRGLIGTDDWEMRFTASGSNYYNWNTDSLQTDRAPFEVWNIGSDTPDDNSDDQRINFSFIDDDDNGVWSWGDRLYFWEQPYVEPAPDMAFYIFDEDFRLGRVVLNDSSGNLTAPAEGTIIRFSTEHNFTNLPADTFTFSTGSLTPVVTGGEGNAVYIEYKFYNKGNNDFSEFNAGFWSDPDLGDANDDQVGCDTLSSTFFCYNADNDDRGYYGAKPPACGFRVLAGPMVPSIGDSALFDGNWISDFKNLGLTSFFHFPQGADPNSSTETYGFLTGNLGWSLQPYEYMGQQLGYMYSGDPVTGEGDLDGYAYDRRMFGVSGPVVFNSGDSQYVLLKFAVGHGNDRLESITKLREILGVPDVILDAPNGPSVLPDKYSLSANYPNPFNPSTTIEYNLPRRSLVKLELFNVLGQKIRTLVNRTESPGRHRVVWDGKNEKDAEVASGVYFYHIRADEFSQTRKMMLLK